MTFYEGTEVRACNEVSAKDRDILKANGIKPGAKGVVVSEQTLVTVNFGGKLVTVSDLAVERECIGCFNDDPDGEVENLMRMFGMKK